MVRPKEVPPKRTATARVVAYLQVSADEQDERVLWLNVQRETIQAEAQRRGWTNIRCFTDEGTSTKSLDRPGIQEALGILSARKADILVVSRLDRLSRSLLDFAALMERSRREGWTVVALDLGVDTSTTSGKMMARVMARFAQFEREPILQRSSATLEEAKKHGRRLGRRVLTPEPIRRRIACERATGRTLQRIADRLNEDGIKTVGGKLWSATSVRKVLLSIERDDVLWAPLRTGMKTPCLGLPSLAVDGQRETHRRE